MSDREVQIQQLAEGVASGRMSRDELFRRAAILGISTSAFGAFLSAAASAAPRAPSKASGKITVVAGTGPGAEDKAWHDRSDAFKKAFPGIEVDEQVTVGVSFYDLVPKIQTMMAGGRAPDVFRVGNYTTATFASRGALLPLNEFIKSDKTLNWNDFVPRARDAMSYGGKVYALPENGESYGLYYNKTAFKEKGLPDPRGQWQAGKWTKAAFLKAATALTEGSGATKKFGFIFDTWNSENWPFINGGRILGNDLKTVLVDKPAAYGGYQFAADLVNKYHVAPTPSELASRPPFQLFSQGVVRMYLAGGWFIANYSQIKDFEWSTTGTPSLRTGLQTSKYEVSGYAITKDSKNPEAAWEYIKFISGRKGQGIWSVVGLPTRTTALGDFRRRSPWAKYYVPFIAQLSNVTWTPFFAKSAELEQALTDGMSNVWLGKESAKDASAGIAKKLRAIAA
jgi:multiple sugar transport system substrate-binding protein